MTDDTAAHYKAVRSRPRPKTEVLDYYERELRAAKFREDVLKRRIAVANAALAQYGICVSDDPWQQIAVTL